MQLTWQKIGDWGWEARCEGAPAYFASYSNGEYLLMAARGARKVGWYKSIGPAKTAAARKLTPSVVVLLTRRNELVP